MMGFDEVVRQVLWGLHEGGCKQICDGAGEWHSRRDKGLTVLS